MLQTYYDHRSHQILPVMGKAADAKRADNIALCKLFDLRKRRYSRCLHHSMDCQKTVIRAHSIQNGRILDLLQRENHVIFPKHKIVGGKPTTEFELIGRNQASTFTGLCADHDTELFRLADTLPLDTGNKEQLNQYAYRAVMRELHACLDEGARFFTLEADNIKNGLTRPRGRPVLEASPTSLGIK